MPHFIRPNPKLIRDEPVTPPATPPHVHEATRGDITGRVGDLQPVVDELVSRMSAPVPLSTLEQAVREALTELEAKYPSSLDLELHTQHFNGVVRFAVEKLREKLESLAPVVAAPAGRDFVFSCPSCGDPSAQTVEADVDIHAGATYRCDRCQAEVIFTAQTPAQYVKLAAPAGQTPTPLECACADYIDAKTRLSGLEYRPGSVGHTFVANQVAMAYDEMVRLVAQLLPAPSSGAVE